MPTDQTSTCGEPSGPNEWFRCAKPAGHTGDRHQTDVPGGSYTWGYVPTPEETAKPTALYTDADAVLDALADAGRLVPAADRPDVLRTIVRPRLVDLVALIDGALDDVNAPAPDDPQALIDQATGRFFEADGSSERVDVIRDLLAGWYTAWPSTAVTDPHEPIAWQLESLIAGAESRAVRQTTAPGRHVLNLDADGWSIDHPDQCIRMTPTGPALVCNVEDLAGEQLTGIRGTPGRYEVTANRDGDRLIIWYRLPDQPANRCHCEDPGGRLYGHPTGTGLVCGAPYRAGTHAEPAGADEQAAVDSRANREVAAPIRRHVTEVDCDEPYPTQG